MLVNFLLHFQQVYVLFELNFLLKFISLVSKSIFFPKFACANLAAKLFAVKLLN